jgi:pyruvate/2-oxoglutarate dehydrogenase complex dihydrolipoamide dehydrogenase (E3) component
VVSGAGSIGVELGTAMAKQGTGDIGVDALIVTALRLLLPGVDPQP